MIPESKEGRSVLEASRKVSNAELLANCNDRYDAQHDESIVPVSQSRENRPKFEPQCFDGNPADYVQVVKMFQIMLSSFLLNDEMKLMYLLKHCTGVAARAIQCCMFMPPDEGYTEAMRIPRQKFGRPSMIVRNVFEAVKGNVSQFRDDSKALSEFSDNLMT
ncbi:unnamed protein product [Trichobilharzia regenti]|nr:unnamed protein product [Trichobilharzia regenti]